MLKAGGTVVNYNPLYTLEELTFQVKDSETELMVTLDLKLLFDKVEGAAEGGRAEARGRRLLPGPAARRQVRAVQAVQGQGAGAPARKSPVARQHHRRGRRAARTTASTRSGRHRPAERRRRAAIHRRHDRHAQGRHAHPRQRLRELPAGRRLGARTWSTGRSACSAALPFFHVFAMTVVMNFAHRAGRRDRHHAALRARRRDEADRPRPSRRSCRACRRCSTPC